MVTAVARAPASTGKYWHERAGDVRCFPHGQSTSAKCPDWPWIRVGRRVAGWQTQIRRNGNEHEREGGRATTVDVNVMLSQAQGIAQSRTCMATIVDVTLLHARTGALAPPPSLLATRYSRAGTRTILMDGAAKGLGRMTKRACSRTCGRCSSFLGRRGEPRGGQRGLQLAGKSPRRC